jgi:hypothetical protein
MATHKYGIGRIQTAEVTCRVDRRQVMESERICSGASSSSILSDAKLSFGRPTFPILAIIGRSSEGPDPLCNPNPGARGSG